MSFPQGFIPAQGGQFGLHFEQPLQGGGPNAAGDDQPGFFFNLMPMGAQGGQPIDLGALFGGNQEGNQEGGRFNLGQFMPLINALLGGNQPLSPLNPEQMRLHHLASSSLDRLRNGRELSNWKWRPFPTIARLAQDASRYAESKLKIAFSPGLGRDMIGKKLLRATNFLVGKLLRTALGVLAVAEVAFFFVASRSLSMVSRLALHKVHPLKLFHQRLNATYYQGLLQLYSIKEEFTIFWHVPSLMSAEAAPIETTVRNFAREFHTSAASIAPIYRGDDLLTDVERSTVITSEFYSMLNAIREGLQRDLGLQLPAPQPINLTPGQITLLADLLVRENMERLRIAISNGQELFNIALAISQGLGVPVDFDPLNANGPSIKINSPNEEGKAYREFLLNLIKEKAREVRETLADEDDLLMPKGISAVLNLTALQEIQENVVHCPEDMGIRGSEDLGQRRELITEAFQIVSTLEDEENQLALLKTVLSDDTKNADDLGNDDDLKRLYTIIGKLRNQLERGPLLTETTLSMRGQESRNLFQQAMMEAQGE